MMQPKPWDERTPTEKSSYFMAIYNAQFRDTVAMASNPNITNDQRQIVRAKKQILSELWPAIQAYDTVVVHGGIPTQLSEQAILDYINRLATLGG
jgi:polysaccharide pyruvyl transferase WcaK-like protein